MIRTFRYPLEPNRFQAATMGVWIERCRQLYNACLEQRIAVWKMKQKSLSFFDQCKELTELRAADPDFASAPVDVERSAIRRLQRAFENFFRSVKAGQTPGFPRFRGRDRYDSFDCGSTARIDGDHVILPKLGSIRFNLYRPLKGEILAVGVQRRAGRWFMTAACDIGAAPEKRPVRKGRAVGIDLGLTSFAVLSDGTDIANPRFFRAGEALLADRQRKLVRKRRGSKSRRTAKLLVAKAHEHVRNQRLNFVRKLACDLFSRFDLVAHEDLSISRMVRGNLAKSINDAAWGLFIHALTSKAECAAKYAVAVDPRGTTVDCSMCEFKVPKTLSEREHRCPNCGFVAGRDHNAALNILARGLRVASLPAGSEVRN